MKCTNLQKRILITRYELNLVSEEERRVFENHLLDCDACFHDLYSMKPVIELMAENKQELLAVLKEERSSKPHLNFRIRIRLFISRVKSIFVPQMRPAWGRGFTGVYTRGARKGKREGRKVPAWGLGLAAVLTVILIIVLVPHPKEYRDMVNVKPVEYQPYAMSLRSTRATQDWQADFAQGMAFYADSVYDEAVRFLGKAYRANSENMAVQYYLGLSYLLIAKTDSAIVYLQKAAAFQSELEAEIRWFLANALLLDEKASNAKLQLQRIVELGGAYEDEASALLIQISELEDTFILLKGVQYFKKKFSNMFKE